MRRLIGADTETVDPCLKAHGKTKARGYSWKYGQGKILCTALYDLQNDSIEVLAGLHNSNTPYSEEERKVQNAKMMALLKDPEVSLVGANILYDIGWWCYEYNMTTYDIKCRFIDVLQAEHILNEFGKDINLDVVSKKYLKFGKTKDSIAEWINKHVENAKGDFRGYLEKAPWDLLVEYVSGDAKNPCLIWRKQLTLLKEQDLCERCKLEFDAILPTLQMTMNGLGINRPLKEVLCKEFTEYMKKYSALFQEKFGEYAPKGFKPTSGKQIAEICEAMHIPFKDKITLKGMDGELFRDYRDTDEAMQKARKLVSSFRFVKSIPVAYVPHELSERTSDILKEHGFLFTCNPNCDKKFFAAQKDNYEVIDIIANWKVALGILSKILGEEYNRFICPDGRIRGQFKITDTVSFRYSSQLPNCIDGNMRVLTPKGWKKIKKLKTGETIYNGNGDITHVKNIWDKGVQKCLLTVSAKGYKIVTTPEHKLWTGEEWKEAKEIEQVSTICRRTGSKNVSLYADKGTDCRCLTDRQVYSNRDTEEEYNNRRIYSAKDTTQNKDSYSLCQSTRKLRFCERVFILKSTFIQRFMQKVQSFLKQRQKLSQEVFDRGAKKGAAQFKGSTSSVQAKWYDWKKTSYLQRRMFGQKRLYNSLLQKLRLCTKKAYSQDSNGRGNRDSGRTAATSTTCTSYRPQSLKQFIGQLGSLFTFRTQKVAQTTYGLRKVYDIEVASDDHSFICEGFRVKNCQQVPSKGSLAVLNNNAAEIRANYPHLASALVQDKDGNWSISFPAITRALFEPSEGKVFWKIDYGQIEYRLICHYAVGEGSKEVREEFARNPHLDFHQYVVDLTGLSRKLAKNMSFGVSFGMGLRSMCENFGWTQERGEEISEAYHKHMPFVAPTLALVGDVAKKRGYIKTVLGSHARLPNPNKSYTMLNRLTQGSGAEILKASIRRAYEEGLWEKLNTGVTVHDELDGEIYPTEEQILNVFRMAEIMTTTVQLKVPLEASPELGMNWASTKEVSEWIKLKNKNDVEYTSQPQALKDAICICERLIKEEKIKVA